VFNGIKTAFVYLVYLVVKTSICDPIDPRRVRSPTESDENGYPVFKRANNITQEIIQSFSALINIYPLKPTPHTRLIDSIPINPSCPSNLHGKKSILFNK
jgi:hypothetical protein